MTIQPATPTTVTVGTTHAAVPGSPRESLMNARSMFQRVLSTWAVDVLSLRRRGWDRPCLRLCAARPAEAAGRRSRRAAGRRRAA
ncbi:MAG TPA: hypothetical protein PKE29_07495 [Phycisphaerales bacterium]|nr:hypothetical protein [Phycisphaerales bacterium]